MVTHSSLTAGFMSLDLNAEVLCRALGVPCLMCWIVLCEAALVGEFGMAWSRCGCERHVTAPSWWLCNQFSLGDKTVPNMSSVYCGLKRILKCLILISLSGTFFRFRSVLPPDLIQNAAPFSTPVVLLSHSLSWSIEFSLACSNNKTS